MPSQSITDAFVRNVKLPRRDAEQKQIAYIDTLERGLALVLIVSYGGSKTFRVVTYRNGKPQSRKLGSYPAVSVKDARAKAREYWQNPQKFEAQAEVGTFKSVAAEWVKRHVEAKKLRSRGEIERLLERYVYPRWKDRPFLEIRRREVNELLDQIADDHGLSVADSTLAILRGLMNWYQARNEDYTSPVVRGMRRQKPKARERILDDNEITLVWKAAEDCGSFGAIVKIALLTAQRRKKIATMRWDDIAAGTWTIRSEEREKGNAGELLLPKLALDVIEAQPRIHGNSYIFASGTKKHFNSWSQRKQELDDMLPKDMPAWTVHDLRRTARSLMSRADLRPDIAERVLGHAIPGVEGVYDRHRYDAQKADALARLAALIETIINPPEDNVVAMTTTRRK
jgi:integrase